MAREVRRIHETASRQALASRRFLREWSSDAWRPDREAGRESRHLLAHALRAPAPARARLRAAFLSAALQLVPLIGAHGLFRSGAFSIASRSRSARPGRLLAAAVALLDRRLRRRAARSGVVRLRALVRRSRGSPTRSCSPRSGCSTCRSCTSGRTGTAMAGRSSCSRPASSRSSCVRSSTPVRSRAVAPPVAVIWLFRWLIFRIMLGAGLIKLRGDPAWRDLTALYYHFETQPLPNPLSRCVPLPAARRAARRRGVQSSRRAGRAVVRARAALGAPRRPGRDRALPGHADPQRQPLVPELAHDRARARMLRRRRLARACCRARSRAAPSAPPRRRSRARRWSGPRGRSRRSSRCSQHPAARQHGLAAADHEHLVRPLRSREHLRRVRHGRARAR